MESFNNKRLNPREGGAPLASFLLFAYNQVAFVEAALLSALEQDYAPMEVIVTDDGSTDGTASVIERVLSDYAGPKPVRFNRRECNGGLGDAINSAVALARGEHIIVAAGDDLSLPERTAVLMASFAADPLVRCLHSNARFIDEAGATQDLHQTSAPRALELADFADPMTGLLGATAGYHRDVFARFAPLTPRLMAEDKVLPFRAALVGRVAYIDEVLVLYRRHGGNTWLGANERARSYRYWREQLRRRRSAVADVVAHRIADTEAVLALEPSRAARLEPVLNGNRRALTRLRLEHELLSTSNPLRKVGLAFRHLRSTKDPMRRKWGWAKQFVLPRLYFRGASPEQRASAITRA